MDSRLCAVGPRQRNGQAYGIYSICSSHPVVLETAMDQAAADGTDLLIEATCNQANQFGGYSGRTPADFVKYVHELAKRRGLPLNRLVIGGDHLGPHVWRKEPAESAMRKACQLVADCVAAGYTKIHLDAGMPLGDDPGDHLPMEISAQRTAELCRVAEAARSDAGKAAGEPVYVVGAEAPTPGGSLESADHVPVTAPDEVADFLDICRRQFLQAGLDDAWQRVVAVVVQPGVDFGDTTFAPYDGDRADALSRYHGRLPNMMTYEIHGTDYQTPSGLTQMVDDHFPLLKTGPVLTFAFREAVFGLAHIESQWLGAAKGTVLSDIRRIIDDQMQAAPEFWQSHYTGEEAEIRWRRAYSFLDRIRYYWPKPAIEAALSRLMENVNRPLPLPLISQYLPRAYPAVVENQIPPWPEALIRHCVRLSLLPYARACRMTDD